MSSKGKLLAVTGGGAALVPKIRFPEFLEAKPWQLVSLRRASIPVDERVGERKLTPVSISAGVGFVPQAEKFGRDISGNQYQLYTLVRDGDFVFNKGNSLKYPQGCIYRLEGWGQVAAPNVFIAFRLKNGYSNGFFQNCFEQNQHGQQLKRHITSGARSNGLLNISKETFFNVEIPTPSLPEQQKIADCLDSADALIAAQGQKLEALKAHKKGLMQQLFPQEGETLPRLRFPEFELSGRWELKLGGELFANRKEKGEAGLPIYSVTISDGMVPRASFDRNFYDIEDPTGNRKAHRGDIVYNMMRMWQGAQGVAPENCLVSPAYVVLKPRSDAHAVFFEYFFKLRQSLRILTVTSRGLTKDRLRLYFDDFAKMPLRVPGKLEQERIANCLLTLDKLIAVESGKLDTLKIHKKGLMQQLFPHATAIDS